MNNIYPRQMVSTWTDEYWLREMAAPIWSVFPYLDMDTDNNLLIGLRPKFNYPLTSQ